MKTQKFFMALAAIAALSLGSCTQEEELLVSGNNYDSLNDPNAVLFGTYMGKAPQSRAGVIDTDSLKKYGFGVYAYYTGTDEFDTDGNNSVVPNFMCNQEVTWDAGASFPGDKTKGIWAYSPVKYWPNNAGEKVSFFAYAPYTETAVAEGKSGITLLPNNETTGDPKIGYMLSENPGEQIDLLYADYMPNLIKQNIDQKVQFAFNHAMTRIGFERVIETDEKNPQTNTDYDQENNALYSLDAGTTVTITEVSLTSPDFFKSGTLNLRTGEWEERATENQTYTLSDKDFTDAKTATNENSSTRLQLNNSDKYLMIFPTEKPIPVWITVKFDVTTPDDNLQGKVSKISSEITTPFEFKFAQGKFYNFVLHIGMTSVKLDATVENWNHKFNDNASDDNEAEVVIDTPRNNGISLIYDANGGVFGNGSEKYIVTHSIGNWDDGENTDHDKTAEAEFKILDFTKGRVSWPVAEDGYTFEGWFYEISNHEQKGKWEYKDNVLKVGTSIFVKKTENSASRTIYAWWATGKHGF